MTDSSDPEDGVLNLSRRHVLKVAGTALAGAAAATTAVLAQPASAAASEGDALEVPEAVDDGDVEGMIEGEEIEHAWVHVAGADQREFPLNDPKILEIYGYTEWLSYEAGDAVRLFVHTTAPTYDIEILRDGARPQKVWSASGLTGKRQQTPEDAFAAGCGWTDPVEIPVDAAWPSGFYLVILRAIGPRGGTLEREAGFVVRPGAGQPKKRIAFILATGTWCAYNDWGGANYYRSIVDGASTSVHSPILSLQRPWGRGFLRLPVGMPRHSEIADLEPFAQPNYPYVDWALTHGYSRHYSDAGWAYGERPFVVWLEEQGYELDVFTQHDLQLRPDCLEGYPCAMIVGHDEYWSWEMRDTMEVFIRKGGHAARFGGNYIWQVRVEDGGRRQVCYKGAHDPVAATDPRRTTVPWDSKLVHRPAAETFGLTGLGGIYVRTGATTPRASGGYTIYRPDHWVFEGTDAYYGDLFGAAPARILAFEVDGVAYTFRDGLPYPTRVDGAPESLEILAMAPAVRGEPKPRNGKMVMAPMTDMPSKDKWPLFYDIPNLEYGAAMMAVMTSGAGEVFNSGCCSWVEGLTHNDFVVTRVTKNVLDRFSKAG